MHEAMLDCLTAFSNNESNKWRSKAMTDAVGLLCVISSYAFIAAFQVDWYLIEYTVGLNNVSMPILYVTLVKNIFIDIRQYADA